MAESRVVGVGVIGSGGISHAHANGYRAFPQKARIVACADIVESVAANAAKAWGAGFWATDYRELLRREDVDAVDICLPHSLHAQAAVEAAEAGKHILIEKPMAVSVEECDEMIRAAEKAGVILMPAHCQVFMPVHQTLREMMQKGYLGKVAIIKSHMAWWAEVRGWRAAPEQMGGGVLVDSGMHRCYLAHFLGGPVEEVTAMAGNYAGFLKTEDTCLAVLRYAAGALGLIVSTWAAKNRGPDAESVEVYGTGGSAVGYGNELHIYSEKLFSGLAASPFAQNLAAPTRMAFQGVDIFRAEVEHFVDCVREGRQPILRGEDGKAAVEIAVAAYLSVKEGRSVKLPVREKGPVLLLP